MKKYCKDFLRWWRWRNICHGIMDGSRISFWVDNSKYFQIVNLFFLCVAHDPRILVKLQFFLIVSYFGWKNFPFPLWIHHLIALERRAWLNSFHFPRCFFFNSPLSFTVTRLNCCVPTLQEWGSTVVLLWIEEMIFTSRGFFRRYRPQTVCTLCLPSHRTCVKSRPLS